MRDAVLQAGAQQRSHRPARMGEAVPSQPEIGLQRRRKPSPRVVLAVGPGRRVDGQNQRAHARAGDAVDQRLDADGIPRKVGLEPHFRILGVDVLEPDQARAADDHRDVCVAGRPGERHVAPIGDQRGHSHRRHAERSRILTPEQRRPHRALRRVAQASGHEAVIGERRPVVPKRRVRLHAARDIREDRTWQVAAGHRLQIVQRQHPAHPGRGRWTAGRRVRGVRTVLRLRRAHRVGSLCGPSCARGHGGLRGVR